MTSVRRLSSVSQKVYPKNRKSITKRKTKDEAISELNKNFCNLDLSGNIYLTLDDYFLIQTTPENIKLLKEGFINQKRKIRNESDLNFHSIVDLIPSHYKHVNNEIKFVCQMVDSLQENEFSHIFRGKYLKSSYPIQDKARYSIVKWLSKFHAGFSAKHSTFELSVAIFDQCLIRKNLIDQISVFKLAITSCLIAFKMEEILIPEICVMLEAVKSNIPSTEIVQYEIEVLKTLQFKTNIYTPGMYLKIFVLIGEIDNYKSVFEMGNLFIDIALMEISLAGYPYSFLAATAYCVSEYIMNNKRLDSSTWNKYYVFLTGIKWEDIESMCVELCEILKTVTKETLNGVENTMIQKYLSHNNISRVVINKVQKLFSISKT